MSIFIYILYQPACQRQSLIKSVFSQLIVLIVGYSMKTKVVVSCSPCLGKRAQAAHVPTTLGPTWCFCMETSWLVGWEGVLAHPQTNQWNHRGRFVTVGPASVWSLDTMPASIYLHPAGTQVFGLVSSTAFAHTDAQMQNACLCPSSISNHYILTAGHHFFPAPVKTLMSS